MNLFDKTAIFKLITQSFNYMKKLFFMLMCIVFFQHVNAQHQEIKYNNSQDKNPYWVQLMYAEKPDIQNVIEAYEKYYKENKFVKNQHTQYYKHWLRNISRDYNGLFQPGPELDLKKVRENEKQYLERTKKNPNKTNSSTGIWESIGPFDYDHDAAGRSYAPGAAHVYTVEQAASNTNVLYAGTATAGLYKSIDYGNNWTLMTANLLIGGIRTIEIDHSNENIVYFGAAGYIYKSVDGGLNWTITGDTNFQNISISLNDLLMHPSNSNILYACTEQGLYKTSDAGTNWVLNKPGRFQEVEFNPSNADIIYSIKQVDDHTEFYKSTDAGVTWNVKVNGWPGIGNSSNSNNFDSAEQGNTTNDYIKFDSNPELGSGSISDFTIEMRIKTSGWSSDPAIFSNKNWSNGLNKGFVVAGNTDGSTWKFNIGDGTNRIDIDGGIIDDDEWHHIAITYDADGDKHVYQDGNLINTSSANISSATNTGLDLALMQDGNLNYGSSLASDISELRIWNRALSQSDIQSYSCSSVDNTHPSYNSLVHHWKVDEGSGNIIADSKGTNDGLSNSTINWSSSNNMSCVVANLAAGEHQRRTEIAVTAANSNVLYALAAGEMNGGSGLVGVYKSTDQGETWTFECCGGIEGGAASVSNPNMLGWAKDGSTDGGQYYYDLTCDVSQSNADEVHIAGIQRWYSTDGGKTFTCPAKWSEPAQPAYIHADIHDLNFFANGDIWAACDGGIYHSSDGGVSFQHKMYGIEGTDFWGFGAGFLDGEVLLGGTYHNSTLLKDNNVYNNGWISTAKGGAGGDNFRGFVNPGKARQVYLDSGKRNLSGNRNISFDDSNVCKEPNATFITGASSRYEFHPANYNLIYFGAETSLWMTPDDGSNCLLVHDFGNTVTAVSVSWSNTDVIYVATYGSFWGTDKQLWKTTDGGLSWSEITPISSWIAWDIAVDPKNENNIWAARVSQHAGTAPNGEMIYQSTDGGSTWTNITTSDLDGEFLTNIIHQHGTDGGIYIGTRRSVYYKNNTQSNWSLFNSAQPVRTHSTRLIPYYYGGKLRNGTDRSVYEVDFYEASTPVAQISVDKFDAVCGRDTFYFVDHSNVNANSASWSWSFPGATYVSSLSSRHPKVVFSNPGSYDITLTVSDANGSDTQTLTDFITVLDGDCLPDTIPGKALFVNTDGYGNVGNSDDLDFDGTKTFTMAAWVKPNSSNMTGYIFTKYDRFVAGQYQFGVEGGKLIGHRETPPWQATGATSLQPNQWYHLATTFDGSQIRVFVNGVEDGSIAMTGSIGSINKDILIGARHKSGNVDEHFDGQIEELAIWNRALSLQEIRTLRHLTQYPENDNSLVAYYQFNETAGLIYDRAGFAHASLEAAATRETSTCPVGGGTSQLLDINSAGNYAFGNTGISLDFKNGGHPDGEIVGFRLNVLPDVVPTTTTIPDTGYWIINNYGLNTNQIELNEIKFSDLEMTNVEASNFSNLKLYKRSSNEDINGWGTSIDVADASAGNNSITYSSENGITSFGQFLIQKEDCPQTLVVNVSPIEGDTMRASVSITSNGEEFPGSDIAFLAGDNIQLEAGFQVLTGASFLAKIENCISTTQIQVNETPQKKSTENKLDIELKDANKEELQLTYTLPTKSNVSITLQSLNGKELIRPIRNIQQSKGEQQIVLLKEQFNQGLYYVLMELDGEVELQKLVNLK